MRLKIIMAMLALIISSAMVRADVEKIPYSWSIYSLTIFPEDWTHIEDKADFDGVTKSMSYSTKTMQNIGADTYTALVAPSQNLLKNDSDPSVYKTVNDYLVSPALKGEVSLYVKRFSAMDETARKVSSVRLFPASKNSDGSYSVDTNNEIPTNFNEIFPLMKTDSQYHKLVANLGPNYQAVAFRFDYVNVANLCAESALIPDTRKIKLNYVELSNGYTSPFKADAQDKVTIKCLINVTNEGNVVLNENDPQYFGMLALMNGDGNSYSQSARGNLPTLQPGETGSSEIEFTFDVPEGETDSNGRLTLRIDGFVSLDGTADHKQLGRYYATTIKVIPYTGIMVVNYDNTTYNPGTPEKPTYIDLGCFRKSKSCEITLSNSGAAPIVITRVQAPIGFSFDKLANLPLTIEPGTENQITETITIDGEYLVEGPITLSFDGTGTNTIYMRGKAIPDGVAFYDFENESIPSEWFTTENNTGKWEIVNNPVTTDKNNKKSLRHSTSSYPSAATTGRLHFNPGEQLNFDVALRSTTSGQLTVRISPDRREWTDIAIFGQGSLFFPSKTSSWQSYSIDMPQGDWYVEFYGSYLFLDNIYGGIETPAALDIVSLSTDLKGKAMVNYPVELSSSFYNFGRELKDYKIRLMVDGSTVKEIDGELFPAKTEKTISLSYYPHEPGEKGLQLILLASSGETILSDVLYAEVVEESAGFETKVGSAIGTGENIPLSINYYNSRSETVYTPSQLGLGACRISSIGYEYYKIMSSDPKITSIRIWMQNTDDESVADSYTPVEDMVLVYENENPEIKPAGNAADLRKWNFDLDTPFDYTGKGLRVVIESHSDYYSKTFFAYDNSEAGCLYSFEDNLEKFNAKAPTKASLMPVTYFGAEKDPVTVTGTVTRLATRSEQSGIEGVEVKAFAKDADIIYSTLTDENGSYRLPVIQTDRAYNIVASHPLYQEPETQEVDFSNPVHHFSMQMIATGIETIETDSDNKGISDEYRYYDLHGRRVINPSKGIFIRKTASKTEKVTIQ